ncbi:hypothetical protein Y788_15720 [Pantoea dispersa 625]|nr:hypothetical protein Y788_15720 [Pantoea dispersa 625]
MLNVFLTLAPRLQKKVQKTAKKTAGFAACRYGKTG